VSKELHACDGKDSRACKISRLDTIIANQTNRKIDVEFAQAARLFSDSALKMIIAHEVGHFLAEDPRLLSSKPSVSRAEIYADLQGLPLAVRGNIMPFSSIGAFLGLALIENRQTKSDVKPSDSEQGHGLAICRYSRAVIMNFALRKDLAFISEFYRVTKDVSDIIAKSANANYNLIIRALGSKELLNSSTDLLCPLEAWVDLVAVSYSEINKIYNLLQSFKNEKYVSDVELASLSHMQFLSAEASSLRDYLIVKILVRDLFVDIDLKNRDHLLSLARRFQARVSITEIQKSRWISRSDLRSLVITAGAFRFVTSPNGYSTWQASRKLFDDVISASGVARLGFLEYMIKYNAATLVGECNIANQEFKDLVDDLQFKYGLTHGSSLDISDPGDLSSPFKSQLRSAERFLSLTAEQRQSVCAEVSQEFRDSFAKVYGWKR
jgi:hypothetical protein